MRQRLPKEVYRSLLRTIDHGEPLDPAVADVVAASMKDWAIEKGAREVRHVTGGGDTAYLSLISRVTQGASQSAEPEPARPSQNPPLLILP